MYNVGECVGNQSSDVEIVHEYDPGFPKNDTEYQVYNPYSLTEDSSLTGESESDPQECSPFPEIQQIQAPWKRFEADPQAYGNIMVPQNYSASWKPDVDSHACHNVPVSQNKVPSWTCDANFEASNHIPVLPNLATPWRSDTQSQLSCNYSQNRYPLWRPDLQPQLSCRYPEAQSQVSVWNSHPHPQARSDFPVPENYASAVSDTDSSPCSNYPVSQQYNPSYPYYNQQENSNNRFSFRQLSSRFQPYACSSQHLEHQPSAYENLHGYPTSGDLWTQEMQLEKRRKVASITERRRLKNVNYAMELLRMTIPFDKQRHQKMSKVKILRYATEYIKELTDLLSNVDAQKTENCASSCRLVKR